MLTVDGRAESAATDATRVTHGDRETHETRRSSGMAWDGERSGMGGGTRDGSVAYVSEDRMENPGRFQNAGESLCGGRVLRFCGIGRGRMRSDWRRANRWPPGGHVMDKRGISAGYA